MWREKVHHKVIIYAIIERAVEAQKEVYLCFTHYTKAFDRVLHGTNTVQGR